MRLKIDNFDKFYGTRFTYIDRNGTTLKCDIVDLDFAQKVFVAHACYDFGIRHIDSGIIIECCLIILDTNTTVNPTNIHIMTLHSFDPDTQCGELTRDDLEDPKRFLNAIVTNIMPKIDVPTPTTV